MAALPPNHHEHHFMRPSSTKMAVAQSTKAKSASKAVNVSPKTKTQMHRRSRTGLYRFPTMHFTYTLQHNESLVYVPL
jgi:hypothetical protein